MDVLDPALDRSSFTIARLERGEVLRAVCKVNVLHKILRGVCPSWTAFTDEEGWEAKVGLVVVCVCVGVCVCGCVEVLGVRASMTEKTESAFVWRQGK